MNKSLLLKQILQQLTTLHQVATDAALQAYNTATHEENVAENKYDTLGLEAAYLAQGQSQRVAECEAALAAFNKLTAEPLSEESHIAIGALVELRDERGGQLSLFMGPAAGGVKLTFDNRDIIVITPSAPLGQRLLGCGVGDEVEMTVGSQKRHYEVMAVY